MTVACGALKIKLGAETIDPLESGVPAFGGDVVEHLFGNGEAGGRADAFALARVGGWLVGAASVPVRTELTQLSFDLYGQLLRAARGLHLARIWNYVPGINQVAGEAPGLENYQAFSRGRSLAFEKEFGAEFVSTVPAASAVGCKSARFSVVFAAADEAVTHIENPLQVPAYRYPPEFGPRPPSFARATIAQQGEGRTVFISGTAAIRGHETVGPGDTAAQLDCTLENLREISLACGLGARLDAGAGGRRFFKIYVRHAAEQPAIAAALEERLLQPGDAVCYLHADICRAALNLEIEATLGALPADGLSLFPLSPI